MKALRLRQKEANPKFMKKESKRIQASINQEELTARNDDRKIMQSIRITSRPSRKRSSHSF